MNPAVAWPEPSRRAAFDAWLAREGPAFGVEPDTLAPASADASFRRYLRLRAAGGSLIVMDAPPPMEDVHAFVQVAGLLAAAGLHAPRVLAADVGQGFVLLTDLGRRTYLDALRQADARQADGLMREMLSALVDWQCRMAGDSLPPMDAAQIGRELELFPQWCVQREFVLTWTAAQQGAWDGIVRRITDALLAQPQVVVHADWMPRNLMVGDAGVGILDFQDAVRGPITYDLASLLRDAFIGWDEAQQLDWGVRWWDEARRAGLPVQADFGEFWQALEWTGLQRHLRILGTFCRLKHRDGKPHYAQELPRFFDYATQVALRYAPLKPLLRLLEPLSGARVGSALTF